MKFYLILLFMFFVCLPVLSQEWQEYTISDGEFFVKLPAEPQEKNQQISSDYGNLNMRMLTLTDGNTNYTVTFTDYPSTALLNTNMDTLLNNARDGALKNTSGKLISEKNIKYENFPGKEIKPKIKIYKHFQLLFNK